ncbi:hypothetical protein NDU88_003318 [Pleurodeles waltl]|uniref:Uncharacterized protein n=1 Tax=Pleurodeles waltl TaxID=8319 RepID=A0AAV7SG70_PLEWA|nr:hypothetical protein NDU88_003318 [Pleurodeles waltl]
MPLSGSALQALKIAEARPGAQTSGVGAGAPRERNASGGCKRTARRREKKDTAMGAEDARGQQGGEEGKDTTAEQPGSNGDFQEGTETAESDEEEEKEEENRGPRGGDIPLGVGVD